MNNRRKPTGSDFSLGRGKGQESNLCNQGRKGQKSVTEADPTEEKKEKDTKQILHKQMKGSRNTKKKKKRGEELKPASKGRRKLEGTKKIKKSLHVGRGTKGRVLEPMGR